MGHTDNGGAFFVLSNTIAFVVRRWRPWKTALVLALDVFTVPLALVAFDEAFDANRNEIAMTLIGCALAWLLCLRWLWLGLRVFDRGMAAEAEG